MDADVHITTYPLPWSPNMYRPLRLGNWHPLYMYPPITATPTLWLYASMGAVAFLIAERNYSDICYSTPKLILKKKLCHTCTNQ